MLKHLVYFIAGFALLVSACQLPDEKEEKSVTNCTEVYEGSSAFRERKYCVWNNSTKTLTVYNWKPGTGPSQVGKTYPNVPTSDIERAKNTISRPPLTKYVFDSDI